MLFLLFYIDIESNEEDDESANEISREIDQHIGNGKATIQGEELNEFGEAR